MQATTAPTIVVGDATIVVNSASQYIVGSQTLSPGGSAVVISDSTYSLPASGNSMVVNGRTTLIAGGQLQLTAAPSIVVDGSTITADAASQYVLGSQTLSPNDPAITVSGNTYSLGPSGAALVVNGQTSATQTLSTASSDATTGSRTDYVLDGKTLSPGSSVEISGTTYSLPTTGAGIYINGVSSQLPTAAPGPPAITIDGIPITPQIEPASTGTVPSALASSVSEFIISGQTLLPGSSIIVSGSTYSLPATGPAFYINGISSMLPSHAAGTPFSLGDTLVTPTVVPDWIVGSQTLYPGAPAMTVSGVVLSAPSGGGELVVGSSTQTRGSSTRSTPIAGASAAVTGSLTSMSTSASDASSFRSRAYASYASACACSGLLFLMSLYLVI